MRDDVVLVIDTNSNYSDVWDPCFGRLDRFAPGIKKYIFTVSYILYNQVQLEEIENVSNVLDETNYSFCKFIKGPELTSHFKDNLYIIDQGDPNFFAQQASIWKTRDFQSIFEAAPSENTRMQHEPGGSDICRQLGLSGLQYFSNTNKRGIHHYDSEIFPCIATAVVKGLWNMSEYPNEMADVVREFKINISSRGWR